MLIVSRFIAIAGAVIVACSTVTAPVAADDVSATQVPKEVQKELAQAKAQTRDGRECPSQWGTPYVVDGKTYFPKVIDCGLIGGDLFTPKRATLSVPFDGNEHKRYSVSTYFGYKDVEQGDTRPGKYTVNEHTGYHYGASHDLESEPELNPGSTPPKYSEIACKNFFAGAGHPCERYYFDPKGIAPVVVSTHLKFWVVAPWLATSNDSKPPRPAPNCPENASEASETPESETLPGAQSSDGIVIIPFKDDQELCAHERTIQGRKAPFFLWGSSSNSHAGYPTYSNNDPTGFYDVRYYSSLTSDTFGTLHIPIGSRHLLYLVTLEGETQPRVAFYRSNLLVPDDDKNSNDKPKVPEKGFDEWKFPNKISFIHVIDTRGWVQDPRNSPQNNESDIDSPSTQESGDINEQESGEINEKESQPVPNAFGWRHYPGSSWLNSAFPSVASLTGNFDENTARFSIYSPITLPQNKYVPAPMGNGVGMAKYILIPPSLAGKNPTCTAVAAQYSYRDSTGKIVHDTKMLKTDWGSKYKAIEFFTGNGGQITHVKCAN